MAGLKIRIEGVGQVGAKLRQTARRHSDGVRRAIRETAEETADKIKEEGDQDIAGAGNFGSRWTDGFTTEVTTGGGNTIVTARMAVPYWKVFQFGNVTHGNPLLWIPLSFATDAIGVRARDYPAPLFRVDRKHGAPLLMTPGADGAQAKYFGKESVTIPKKFHLVEIAQKAGRRMAIVYRRIRRGQ